MTYWGDHDRVEKITRVLKDIRHDIGIIERVLRHMGTKVLDVELNRGVSGEGETEDYKEQMRQEADEDD